MDGLSFAWGVAIGVLWLALVLVAWSFLRAGALADRQSEVLAQRVRDDKDEPNLGHVSIIEQEESDQNE